MDGTNGVKNLIGSRGAAFHHELMNLWLGSESYGKSRSSYAGADKNVGAVFFIPAAVVTAAVGA